MKNQGTETINLDPATEDDLKRADDNKDTIVNRDERLNSKENETAKPDSRKSLSPTITYLGQYGSAIEIGGYTEGVYETEGTCTVTYVRGSEKITKSVSAVRNVNSMDCPQ